MNFNIGKVSDSDSAHFGGSGLGPAEEGEGERGGHSKALIGAIRFAASRSLFSRHRD